MRHLARLPRLRHLNLMGCGITDRGLEVLRRLPALETIVLAWTRITDAGAAHLAACEQLRNVDLSGTLSGDGAIRALAGKRELRNFRSGNAVTDAGLPDLHEIPAFKSWQGGEPRMALLGFDAGPNYLMLRGPFTDSGLAQLVGLDGLFALNVDSDQLAHHGGRARAARQSPPPRLARLRCEGRVDAAHRGVAAPPLPDVPGHDRRRRRVRRAEPIAIHRAHLGAPLPQPATPRVHGPGRHAGACGICP